MIPDAKNLEGQSYVILKNSDSVQLAQEVSFLRSCKWRLYGPLLAYSVTCTRGADTWQEFEFAQAMERDL